MYHNVTPLMPNATNHAMTPREWRRPTLADTGDATAALLGAVGGTLQDVTTPPSQSAPRCRHSPTGGTAERPGCAAAHQQRLSQNTARLSGHLSATSP